MKMLYECGPLYHKMSLYSYSLRSAQPQSLIPTATALFTFRADLQCRVLSNSNTKVCVSQAEQVTTSQLVAPQTSVQASSNSQVQTPRPTKPSEAQLTRLSLSDSQTSVQTRWLVEEVETSSLRGLT
jgi:hypothetical protein